MTTPIFQPPGQPTGRTGTCPECGRENVPMLGKILTGHTQQRVKGRANGLPVYVDTTTHCDGSGGAAEEGSQQRPGVTRTRADGAA